MTEASLADVAEGVHECCPCVAKLTDRVVELEQAQEEHIQTHRREAMLGLPVYDRRSD